MDAYKFNQMVKSWPVVRKQVGELADGTKLYVEVHSFSGQSDEANDEG